MRKVWHETRSEIARGKIIPFPDAAARPHTVGAWSGRTQGRDSAFHGRAL